MTETKSAATGNGLYAALAELQKQLPVVGKDKTGKIPGKDGKQGYCLAPQTRVLTADLRWVPIGDIELGERLAGFDEEPVPELRCRRWRTAIVEAVERIAQPSYRVTLTDGTVIVASETHRWLTVNGSSFMRWIDTRDLRAVTATGALGNPYVHPTGLVKVLPVWGDYKESFENGYLAAAFDGEGTIVQTPVASREESFQMHVSFAQRRNAMHERVQAYLDAAGFVVKEQEAGTGTNLDVYPLRISGGRSEVLRFLGTVRPVRLLSNLSFDRLGTLRTMERVVVQSVKFIGVQEVVSIATDTKTLIAEGIASHNSYSYADLADITAAIMPLLGKHGLAFTARPTLVDGNFVLAYSLVHASGEHVDGMYPLSGGTHQAVGSAITYARRYSLCAVTGVAPDTDDDDGAAATAHQQSAGEAFDNATPVRPASNGQAAPGAAVVSPDAEPDEEAQAIADEAHLARTVRGVSDCSKKAYDAGKLNAVIVSPEKGGKGQLDAYLKWRRTQVTAENKALDELNEAAKAAGVDAGALDERVRELVGVGIEAATVAQMKEAAAKLASPQGAPAS